MMALVVDDEAEVALVDDPRQPLLVEGADRADQHLGVVRGFSGALLHRHHARAVHRALQLLASLGQQLLAMRQDEHLPPRQTREVREDDRLARAGRQAHDHATNTAAAGRQNSVDRLALVRTEGRCQCSPLMINLQSGSLGQQMSLPPGPPKSDVWKHTREPWLG